LFSLTADFRQTGDFGGLPSLEEKRGGSVSYTATQKWFSILLQESESFAFVFKAELLPATSRVGDGFD